MTACKGLVLDTMTHADEVNIAARRTREDFRERWESGSPNSSWV